VLREFVNGWSYVAGTPLVRGLVLGILGAFAGAGVVIGTAQFYARSLSGGDSTFFILSRSSSWVWASASSAARASSARCPGGAGSACRSCSRRSR